MNSKEATELLAYLPKERTLYAYCRDRYLVDLLAIAAERHPSIQALKGSCFGRLLEKPAIKPMLKSCGSGRLDRNALLGFRQDPSTTYLLTAGLWGGKRSSYYQTSRPGFNLVLRLNFNRQHDRLLQRTLHPKGDGIFNFRGHPWLARGERPYFRETLAWARLDIDLDAGEVLVEEVQSDWVREISWLSRRVGRCRAPDTEITFSDFHTTAAQAQRYLQFFDRLGRDWSQAMLGAVIRFVRLELGIDSIWYHTWETGNCLKRINPRWAPPLSLYTRLPRQFCFQKTDRPPAFLRARGISRRLRRARIAPLFYYLNL